MRLLVGLMLLCASAFPVLAQDADEAQRKSVARELVVLTTADAVMGPMIDAVWPTLEQQIGATGPAIDAETMVALKETFSTELRETMESVLDDYAALYAENFTLDELNDVLAFYKSTSGVKLIEVQPKIMNQMLPLLTQKLQITLPIAMRNVVEEAQRKRLKTP